MAGRKVTTHEATIQTATVEVKSLTIGGRQVTLSVFRQLQREPVIDLEAVKLDGVPWGRVHYFPDAGCAARADRGHLHVVWQKGAELRRACLDPLSPGPETSYRCPTFADSWRDVAAAERQKDVAYAVAFGLLAAADPAAVRFEPEEGTTSPLHGVYAIDRGGLTWRYRGSYGGSADPLRVLSDVASLVWSRDHPRPGSGYETTPEAVRATAGRFAGSPLPTPEEALAALGQARATVQDRTNEARATESRYADLYRQLADLPQLFIAT